MRPIAFFLIIIVAPFLTQGSAAQRSLGVTFGIDDFSYTGEIEGGGRFDFQGPVVGIAYSQYPLSASLVIGPGTPTLLEFSFGARFRLRQLIFEETGLSIPFLVTTAHRRSSFSDSGTRWAATRFGVGPGLQWIPPRSRTLFRVNGIIGLIASDLVIGSTFSYGMEAEAAIPVRLSEKLQIFLAYTFRFYDWNINSRRGEDNLDRYFDYRSLSHGLNVTVRL